MPAALGYRQPRREVNLAVLPLYPGLRAAHLRGLLDSGVEALLLECYGSGTGPSDDEELLALLREAHARGVLLAAVSQCAYGQGRCCAAPSRSACCSARQDCQAPSPASSAGTSTRQSSSLRGWTVPFTQPWLRSCCR